MCNNHQKAINASDTPAFFAIDNYGFPVAGEHPADPPNYYPAYFTSERFQKLGYHVEELRGGFYWVTSGGYDAAFVVTDDGVIAIDAPPTIGENMLAAIEGVTDKPVTHVIYSHWHTDHIGAASVFGPNVEIVAHEITKELLERFPDPEPSDPDADLRQGTHADGRRRDPGAVVQGREPLPRQHLHLRAGAEGADRHRHHQPRQRHLHALRRFAEHNRLVSGPGTAPRVRLRLPRGRSPHEIRHA
ncbi:MBL fold metallo-hydrolase [Rhizobium ruizarguesonis]|uniref:MBL fold metallo-hydrolase n=1 Tax=Rhizobium ruizarguesonis TaxID=2081791 RepID=A0ACD5ENS2_9HYPH